MPTYRWTRESIKKVPKKGGVYTIKGLLFSRTGQSKNVRRRLLEHQRRGSHGLLFPLEVGVTFESNDKKRRRLERRRGGR